MSHHSLRVRSSSRIFAPSALLIMLITFVYLYFGSTDQIGCDVQIKSDALWRINWTMVLPIPWYGTPCTLGVKCERCLHIFSSIFRLVDTLVQ